MAEGQETSGPGTDGSSNGGESKIAEAAEKLQKAMEIKEEGARLYQLKQYTEAREEWRKALLEVPETPNDGLRRLKLSLHLNLSQCALQLSDWEDVVKQATFAAQIDSESSKAYYRRGLAHDALGKRQSAASDMQKAARLEPRSGDIRKKYEEFKKKMTDIQEEEDDTAPEHNAAALPRAYMDIAVGDSPAKRIVFALYTDTAPKTAENFRQLCTGEHSGKTARGKPFHYKNSILHRMVPGLMVQGGDFENANGTGGESIYGRRFADEFVKDLHDRRGLLAMANDGPNTNGSNFFVSFAAAEHLNKRHVIFGEVVEGLELLDEIEKMPTNAECRPVVDCVIVGCGDQQSL